MERKLVSIRQIKEIHPIEGADLIELAIIDGWQLVVKKGEFMPNGICVYFEIDSFLPKEDLRFSFLEKSLRTYEGKEGYRIKTMKLRGQISQGLALPIASFPEIYNLPLGEDVTEKLKVIKYDVAVLDKSGNVFVGNAGGKFPSFIPKTDEERIQNLTRYFKMLKGEEFEETLKLDGSSCTMYKILTKLTLWDKIKQFFGFNPNNYHFGVCSRNLDLKRPSENNKSDFWDVAIKLGIENKLPFGFAIQGELVGPKIQRNHEKLSENDFYCFNVYDIENKRYLNPIERQSFLETFGIKSVPVVNKAVKIFEECKDVNELLLRVKGQSMNKGTISEGRVYKCLRDPNITFKCINNDYLIKCED